MRLLFSRLGSVFMTLAVISALAGCRCCKVGMLNAPLQRLTVTNHAQNPPMLVRDLDAWADGVQLQPPLGAPLPPGMQTDFMVNNGIVANVTLQIRVDGDAAANVYNFYANSPYPHMTILLLSYDSGSDTYSFDVKYSP